MKTAPFRTGILVASLVIAAATCSSDLTGPKGKVPDGAVAAIPPTNNSPCTVRWASGVNGSWADPTKWNPAGVPTASSSVCIDAAGTYTVTVQNVSPDTAIAVDILALTVGGAGATPTVRFSNNYTFMNITEGVLIEAGAVLNVNNTRIGIINAGATITNNGTLSVTTCNGCAFGDSINADIINNATWSVATNANLPLTLGKVGGQYQNNGTLTMAGPMLIPAGAGNASFSQDAGDITGTGGSNANKFKVQSGTFTMNSGKVRTRNGVTNLRPVVIVEGANLVISPAFADSAVFGALASSTTTGSITGSIPSLVTLWMAGPEDSNPGTVTFADATPANNGQVRLGTIDGNMGTLTIGGTGRLTNASTIDAPATGGTPVFHFGLEVTNNGTIGLGEDMVFEKAGGTYYNAGTISGSLTLNINGATLINTATGTVTPTGSTAAPNFRVDGGRLIGLGTVGDVTLVNGGTAEPGLSPGVLTANSVTVNTGTALKIELGGTQVGTGYDQLALMTSPNTPGSLDVSEINGFLSGVCGQEFEVLTHNLVGGYGGFGTYNGLNPAASRALRVFNKTTAPKKIVLYGYDPTVKVSVAPNPVAIAEGGAGVQYAVCLDGVPALTAGSTVTVTPTPNAQVTVSPPSVIFTSSDWFAPKFFTVTAVDDNVNEGNHTGTVTHAVTSGVAAYNGAVVAALTANITDNDVPPPQASATSVGSNLNPSTVGQSVTFTATVSSGGGTPDGSVQFKIDGNDVGSPVALVGGQAQFSTSTLTVGNHTVQATYGGSSGFLGSNGSLSGGQTVNPSNTTTGVASSVNPSTFGQSVTFTATVSSSGGIPTGSVQFNIDNSNVGGPVTLDASGQATFMTSSLGAGNHPVKATYSGSTNFAGGFGTLSGGQTVNAAGSTTVVTSNLNPSTFGQSVTFTAAVSSVAGTPAGSVQFNIDNSNVGGPVTLDVNGQATFSTSSLAVGNHVVKATYGGGGNIGGSLGTLSNGQTVNQASSTTGVGSSLNPSTFGQQVTFTATVSASVGTPGGTVQFSIDGGNVGSPVALVGGQATFQTSTLSAANHTVGAVYSGNATYQGSNGALGGGQNVNPAGTSTGVSSSANPSVSGQSVTFTATVSSGAGTPSGTVQFNIDGSNVGSPVSLTGGQASFTTSTLAVRNHPVVATYAGGGNYATSNGSLSGGQTVNPPPNVATSTGVSSSSNPSAVGQSVTFTVTVTSGGGTPTGTVQFNIDGTNVGGAMALDVNGQATYSTSTLTLGNHPVQATYSGATGFLGSNGALTSGQQVNATPTTTTVASVLTATPQYSDKVTLQATVTPHQLGASELTGMVYFYIGSAPVSCGTSAPPGSIGNDAIAAADDGVAQIDYQALYVAGSHTITACFYTSNALFSNSGDTESIVLAKEHASVAAGYTYGNAYQATGTTPAASFALTFTLRETNPEPDANAGAMPGDVDLAGITVHLVAVGNSANNKSVVCSPSAAIATPAAYSDIKTFTCNFSNVSVDAYEIDADVTGNYFQGGLIDALTVYDPAAGFVSGGGRFRYAGPGMDVVSFGLSFNFTGKTKTTPRGNVVVIRQMTNGDVCRGKSNAIDAPAIVGTSASFSGKANYVCTRPNGTTYDGAGNETILGWVQDNGQPGGATPDRIWLRLTAPNSALLMPTPATTNAQGLIGGNIQVPHN